MTNYKQTLHSLTSKVSQEVHPCVSNRFMNKLLMTLLLCLGTVTTALATDYVHIMLGAADGSGKRQVTARFVRTNRNDNGRLEASQMSPLVNTHRYYSAATDNGDGTFTVDESSEITSGNHFATAEVVTCYVTYDDYDHSIFSGTYRITLGDGQSPLNNYEKYWTASTSGIFTTSDGTYSNADLWTVTGDPYSMQIHPYSQSTKSVSLGEAGGGSYDSEVLKGGNEFKLLPTATANIYNKFYLTTYTIFYNGQLYTRSSLRVNSSVDGNPIQNSEADGLCAGPNWYSSGTQLKAWRERRYSATYFVKTAPTDPTRRFHILNSSGVQECLWESGATTDLELQRFIKSPFCSNYRYATSSDMTGNVPEKNTLGWVMDIVPDIYVKYDYDNTVFSGTRAYKLRLKSRSPNIYVGSPSGEGELSQVTSAASATQWKISGTPYAFRIIRADDPTQFITTSALTAQTNVLQATSSLGYDTFSATYSNDAKATFSIYVNPGAAVSVLVNSRSALGSPDNRTSNPVRIENQPYNSIKGWGDWNAVFEGNDKVTYHVVNLAGEEVVAASDYVFDGESLRVPDAIRSPLATSWTFYGSLSDAQNKTNAIVSAGSLSDIYARYEYDNATSAVDLSGKTLYQMQFAEVNGRYIYEQDRTNNYIDCDRSTLLYNGEDYEQFDRFYWTFTGNDPYNLSVVNRRLPSMVMSKPSSGTGAERGRMLADGTSGAIQRFALMQNPSKVGMYELMGLYDSGTANLFYYLRTEGSQTKILAHSDYQTGNTSVQIQITPYRCYHIIDNSGSEAIQRLAPATMTLAVPDKIKSPLLPSDSQYRYYASLTDATANAGAGQNALNAASTPVHTYGDIYVRYDYNSSTSPLDLSGATWYVWKMPSGGDTRYHYANSNVSSRTYINTSSRVSDATIHSNYYHWAFSGNDPYRISINNEAYDGRVLATNPDNLNYNNTQNIYMRLPGDVTGTSSKYFLITQASGLSSYQLILADGRNHPTNYQGADDTYYYMMNNNGDYPFIRAWEHTNQDGSTMTQHIFYQEPLYYAVVNKQGEIAMDGYYVNTTSTIGMMPNLKTPYLPDDSSYKFFTTQADAAKYTRGDTPDNEPITLLSQVTDATVFVGYHYDAAAKAAKPAALPVLDGTKNYYMKGWGSGENFRYFYTQNRVSGRPNNAIGIKGASTQPTADTNYSHDMYYWRFTGDDPYAITITNAFTGTMVYANPTANSWGCDYQLSGTQSLSMCMLYDGERYTLACIRPTYALGTREHVTNWGFDSGNNVAQLVRTAVNPADTYYQLEDGLYGHLEFIPTPPEYIIVNNAGEEVFRWKDSNNTLRVNEWVASPLADNYRFYTSLTDAQSDASAGAAQPSALAVGATAEDGGIYYVRYSLAASPQVDITSGNTWYKVQLRGTDPRYIYYVEDNYVELSETATDGNQYLWLFSGSDPYDIHIQNRLGEQEHPGYYLTARQGASNNGGLLNTKGQTLLNYQEANSESHNLSNMHLQSFFFVKDGSDNLHLAGAYNGYLFNADNNKSTYHQSQAYFLFVENPANTYPQMNRVWNNQRTDQTSQITLSPVRFVTYHLTTRGGTALADYPTSIPDAVDNAPIPLPDVMARKFTTCEFYTTFDGTQADYDDRYSNKITTIGDLKASGATDIYVKYTVDTENLPFKISTDYEHAKWYRIKVVEGDVYAHLSETAQVAGVDDTYTHDYQYAFFGDPYELKVANRAGGEGMFLGVAAGAVNQAPILPIANGTSLNTWEILPAATGEAAADFRLRVLNTATTVPYYCGFSNGKACYFSTAAITMRLSTLPEKNYTYHIVDLSDRIAIKGTVTQDVTTPITMENLPSDIISPYISDESITAYQTAAERETVNGRKKYNLSNVITETPLEDADIYITYTTDNLSAKPYPRINGRRSYNIVQPAVSPSSDKYVYTGAGSTVSVTGNDADRNTSPYLWSLNGSDPYAVEIQNISNSNYLALDGSIPPTMTTGALSANSFFIFMGSDANDKATMYLVSESTTPSSTGTTLQFTSNLGDVTYYIIDKRKKIVISATSSSGDLEVPAAISSPLVSQYHFYTRDKFNIEDNSTDSDIFDDTYTLNDDTELNNVGEALASGMAIYVTYDIDPTVDLDGRNSTNKKTYMLQFLHGESFNQEDGSDDVMTATRKAVYPYSNGESNLYIYGQERWDEQLASGASTRSRWLWILEGGDPYHVKISSNQTQTNVKVDGVTTNYHSYLRTYKPDGYASIVTGVTNDNPRTNGASTDTPPADNSLATEYMILGTAGHSKLVTTLPVSGSGKENDYTVASRETVTSFEQYWKNNPTVRTKILKNRAELTEPTADIVEGSAEWNYLTGTMGWHAYDVWANTNYNTENVWTATGSPKNYSKSQHWFQTVSMGDGEFVLEEVSLTAVLVLLDQHGWEIARINLPKGPSDPQREARYRELHKYNSPMVKRYHYYKVGNKVPGYHKYTVSDYAIDPATGLEYTSEGLGVYDALNNKGSLPDYSSQAQDAKGNDRDWYVTYDVKDEWAGTYTGAATQAGTKASAFFVKQNSVFATTDGTSISTTSTPSASIDQHLWLLRPNFNIDAEMGYNYGGVFNEPSKAEKEVQNYNEGRNGFDPYNVQLQSMAYTNRYFSTNATTAALASANGVARWTGNGSSMLFRESAKRIASATGYDQTSLNITNTTFMVLDDGNGNMRLTPRFDNGVVMQGITSLAASATAAAANDQTGAQTLLLAKPTTYTYHVINKNNREAITWKDNYTGTDSYRPAERFPAGLKAYGASNFRFLPASEFDQEAMARDVYNLINPSATSRDIFTAQGDKADIYVVYDVDTEVMTTKGFSGNKVFNIKMQKDGSTGYFIRYDSSNTKAVSSAKTSLTSAEKTELENVWMLEAKNLDPYDVSLLAFTHSNEGLYQTFILKDWDAANNKFRLLATNSANAVSGGEPYGYLSFDGSNNIGIQTKSFAAIDNTIGITLSTVNLAFTYQLYDLSGNLTLQADVSDISDMTPSLPEHLRSPLVKDYHYYQEEDMVNEITSLTHCQTIAGKNYVYVGYEVLPPDEAILKLDGSQTYTFHTKNDKTTLAMGYNGNVTKQTVINRRPNFYEHTLLGREINGQFDPYDIAVYSPFQNKYWGSADINNNSDRTNELKCNAASISARFMILNGVTEDGIEYVQIAQKKMSGTTYYPSYTGKVKYVFFNGSQFYTGQGTSYVSGNANQMHTFQIPYRYHVLNMQGTEAVNGIESRIVIPSTTTPQLPEVLQSPIVNTYHYYDITAFDVNDGVYTLKGGATELRYVSDATTNDVYVVYTNADLDKSWDLNGGKVYNIIFAPDALTLDGLTETLNSYFGYEAGLKYMNDSKVATAETSKFQVTGSYCTSYLRHIVVNDASKKGTDTGSRVYEVEADLTSSQTEENTWLWSFSGADPYALEIHNMKDPTKYIYRNSDSGGYTIGLTLGTTTNAQRRTFMLTGRGTGDDTRFNLMASGPCTGGSAPYSYQYIGRSYHDNPHRTTRRGVVLQGLHEWHWNYTYDEPLVTVKIVPRKIGKVTYIVKNNDNQEAIRMKVEQSTGIAPEIPTAIKSPYAKDFKYWTNEACTSACTETSDNTTIYVTYTVDTEALASANIDLSGASTYNIWSNNAYLYNSGNTLNIGGTPENYSDTVHEWYLEGNDPYDVRIKSKGAAKYIEAETYYNAPETGKQELTTLIADNSSNQVRSFILMDGQPGNFELLAATADKTFPAGIPSSEIKNRLGYLGNYTGTGLLGVGTDDSTPIFQSGQRFVQIRLTRPLKGYTYHIMNLNGLEAVQYTVEAQDGEALKVPDEIRSPLATNWKYWSDEACTVELVAIDDNFSDIYVTYTYNDATQELLQIDGTRFYNMKVNGIFIQESEGAINGFTSNNLTGEESNVVSNLWSFNGSTLTKGIDPYALRLINQAYADIYAGAVMNYVEDTENLLKLSDGEDYFRSQFFLVSSDPAGPYEVVLASGKNISNNVLAYVNRHDGNNINLTRQSDYQYGNSSLKVEMVSPTGRYLYKVIDRSGRVAVQAWGDGVAGGAPEIPNIIKSPLVSQYYYDVEVLPYTVGTEEIRVTYDVDDDNLELIPNLSGTKAYNIKFRNNWFAEKSGENGITAAQDNSKTNKGTPIIDDFIWKPSADMGDGRIDPYDVKLYHSGEGSKLIYTPSISSGQQDIALGVSAPASHPYERFILIGGTEDNYQLMVASGEEISNNSFAYLGINSSNEPKVLRGNAYTQNKTLIQVALVPFQDTYTYVIVNNDMYEAMRYAVVQDGGNPVVLPSGLRSPLIDLDEYEYYTAGAFSQVGSYQKQVGESTQFIFADDITKAANKITTLPYGTTTIYVRYSNSMKPGGLDLSGVSRYQIMNHEGNNEYYLYGQTSASNHSINTNNNLNETERPKKYYQWRLYGDDPYNVKITNVYREDSGDGNMNSDILMATELWYRNGGEGSNYQARNQSLEMRPENYANNAVTNGKYRVTRFAILGHEDGNYRVMGITPFFWDSEYYDLSTSQRTAGGNNLKQERYYTMDNRWALYSHGRDNYTNLLDMNVESGISVQFLPMTNHNYRFHLTTKVNGRKIVIEKPNVMARSLLELPEELKRKYCTYTAKYYVNKNGSDNPANWDAVDKDAASAEEITLDLTSGAEVFPYFYKIDVMPESTEAERTAKANTWVDIYVDYTAHQRYMTETDNETGAIVYTKDEDGKPIIDPNGMPFNVMAWDATSVQRLLDNEGGFTDAIFQISTYDQLTQKVGSMGLQRKDYLYFMVMKTDNTFSNSNGQYFLRREDDGRISYLNNSYAPHYNASDNVNNWSYSRCAETYRENDHEAFQEKKWLWCFAGDPYDMYLFNGNSVVQETFNTIEGIVITTVHRDHLVNYQTQTNTSGTTTEHVVNTPGYDEAVSNSYRWGIAEGKGASSDKTFSLVTGEFTPTGNADEYKSPTNPNIDNEPLFWRMDKSVVDGRQEVLLQKRNASTTILDYNIQVLPYEPTSFQDVRLVLRRADDVSTYTTTCPTPVANISDPVAAQAQTKFIDELSTGTIRMYTSSDDRQYAIGDEINIETMDDLPFDLRRKFCTYTSYSDDYRNAGKFVITEANCAYRGAVQRYPEDYPVVSLRGQIIYNDAGKPMYNYWMYVRDGSGNIVKDGAGNPITRGAPPMSVYIKYDVNNDKFLRKHPTKTELATMIANNDHVYFMDFANPNIMKGEELAYNTGHHAYNDPDRTFSTQIDGLHDPIKAEKMIWNGSKFVYDTSQLYNYSPFHTVEDRMESIPERLKWYFVGDPYKLQVYCTQDAFNESSVKVDGEMQPIGTVGSNLCRFDPTETAFQFVVDCVHFRVPDEDFIDERETISYLDTDGSTKEIDNPNQGKPYYPNFYWEVVPTTTDDEEAFALRFRADNNILGYRDVFYYLTHDGLKRTYREAISDNPKAYGINLSYDEDNNRYLTGKYIGYHKSNGTNCAIRLTQPAKIYFSAYKETYSGEPVVKEELSEYFGVGETIKEVPRHLQRKFVSYSNLQYQKNNNPEWQTEKAFPFKLEKNLDAAFNLEDCSTHATNTWTFTQYDTNGIHSKMRASYKFRVTYETDDITKDGVHLFTTPSEFANENVQPQWLDFTVGGNHWAFYDKTNIDNDKNSPTFREENQIRRITSYPTTTAANTLSDGWEVGIKGLHWAFIGDPYKFTVINRRRWEDSGSPRTAVSGSDFWLGTGYGQAKDETGNPYYNYTRLGDTDDSRDYGGHNGASGNDDNGNTEWSLQMCKTGGASDYFIRTSSLKTTVVDSTIGDYSNNYEPTNMTNDYARLVYKDFTNLSGSADPQKSAFTLETFGLSTKTKDIAKADIRTAVAEDEDNANNDCFDANVRIYNTNGELKASLKHVELKYDDVFKSIPATIRRYGCNYIECYQLSYGGFTDTELENASAKETKRTAINTQLQSLANFSGENRIGSLTEFMRDGVNNLNPEKIIRDDNGRRYYEIAYVYAVDDDVAKYISPEESVDQSDYYWTNANYQWDQVYRGSNVRVVTYENVFDHYEYNADGHIVNEVYKQVEKVEYKSGDYISTQAYGWLNSHDGYSQAYGDEGTQSEDNDQKWAFVGDPYDFSLTNYSQYLANNSSALYYNESTGINASNVEKSHWAIVQGLQKTAIVNGTTKNVYTDAAGNTVYEAKSNGVANTPVYVYYLALIDDDEMSDTYGTVIQFVTFDRATESADLPKEEQYLKLRGGVVEGDPTAMLYTTETKNVHPFYIADLMSYANMVVYHLVMAHQHSLDYSDADMTNTEKSKVDQHLVEWLKYKYPAYMDTESVTYKDITYTKKADKFIVSGNITSGTGEVTEGSPFKDRMNSGVKNTIINYLKKGTLRDVVNDEIPDYSVTNVGIGNTLTVPWYMKRQFTKYKLYQNDVKRSEIDYSNPDYEVADEAWIVAGGQTMTIDGVVYKVDPASEYADPVTGRVQRTFIDENGVTQRAYNIKWTSLTEYTGEDDKKVADKKTVLSTNGTEIAKLSAVHKNRLVVIDVVYDVDDSKFSFADEGRNSTDWYQLMTNDENDGLVNFSYKDGVGAGRDCSVHYTNNYLWAPEGDPYGFVLRSRYATVNGTGWDNVALTTANTEYDNESSYELTHSTSYDKKNIHYSAVNQNHNAIYEMYVGLNDYSFLMHPTGNLISTTDEAFNGFYMTHNTTSHEAELKYSTASMARLNKDANWRLMVTPEQLLPYFEHAGYVGGLKPSVAKSMTNASLYTTLQNYRDSYRANPAVIDFHTIDGVRQMVYSGTFYKHGGTVLSSSEERPTTTGSGGLPLTFKSDNLVPLEKGYYRIQSLSTDALTHDGSAVDGIVGPRYVSGYLHESEKDYSGYNGEHSLTAGSLPLHFVETDEAHTTFHTWGDLRTAISSMEAGTKKTIRTVEEHPAMRGNIEIPAVEYDPSSIFYFEPTDDAYDRYRLGTQDLSVNASVGSSKLDATATPFRMNDVGGGAFTVHTMATENASDATLANNLKTNYLCIDANHRYQITVNANNEMSEIGDDLEAWTKDGAEYAIQNTKWLLQPVGSQKEWPYNEMPLRVKVNKGGDSDNNYYSTLYVPFDTRLSNTIDAAFTSIKDDPAPTSLSLIAVGQLNNMNNALFIPAEWPVVIRTGKPKRGVWKKWNASSKAVVDDGDNASLRPYYVELGIPNSSPTSIPDSRAKIRLCGQYLEKVSISDSEIDNKTGNSTWTNGRLVMVFGLPFIETGEKSSWSNEESSGSMKYYKYNESSSVGFYTNENWQRGHEEYSSIASVSAYSDAAADDKGAIANAHWATARNATSNQRSNKYLYSNKVFYVYDYTPGGGSKPFLPVTFSDGDEKEGDHPIDEDTTNRSGEPWPCDVFDLMGRRVATDETPSTLLRNHPNLPAGVYIFGGRKVIVK